MKSLKIIINNNITFYVMLLFLLFYVSNGIAQENDYFPNIQYITSDEGLSQNEVTSILQDRKGFLWIGTRGGLNRFDGSSFRVYQNEIDNSNSLVNNSVETLFEDHKSNIWIGTKSNGVSRYSIEFDRFEQIQPDSQTDNLLIDQRVIAIAESSINEIWFGTWTNGLSIFNTENKTSTHFLDGTRVTDILKSKDNKMWVTTSDGIYVFSENGEQLDHITIASENIEFTAIIEDERSGNFYLGTWGEGLIIYNPITKKHKQFKYKSSDLNSLSSNNAYHLFQDNQHNLWIGTWGGGISRFNPETEVFANFDLSAGQNKGGSELYRNVLSIFEDRTGGLWFGTDGGGVCKVDRNKNQFGLKRKELGRIDLPKEPVWFVFKDKSDYLWVGLKGNENIFYSDVRNVYSRIKLPNPTPDKISRKEGVRAIYEDREGTLWLAGNYFLLEVQKNNKKLNIISVDIKNEDKSNLQSNLKITSLYQTSNGIFWIGTQQNGLRKSSSPGNPKTQSFQTYLKNERISTFLEDKTGQFWVGTYGGLQLYRPNKNDFLRYSKKQGEKKSLSSNIIICLYEDKQGNLWIGTPNGLNLAIKGENQTLKFKSFQEKDGLANNYVHSILEDENGNLWISTNKGISKYNIKENSFYNYDVNDGLRSNSFMENAAIKDSKGIFYFGGIYGISIFHPDSIHKTVVPSAVLTGLRISGQEIRPGVKYNDRNILKKAIEFDQEITLTHKENIFSIDYTALDFHSSSGYLYKFMMEGLDEDWNTTTTQKNVTYSNLKAGNYTFKVKTISEESENDSSIASLQIKILPPFWQTWQAFILYTLIFIGLLFLFSFFIAQQTKLKSKLELAELSKKKEEELAEMKTQFFTDIAHEFRTPLSLISGPVESMMESKLDEDQRNSHLSTIHYHTQRLLNLVSQLLDFRKAEKGKMVLNVVNDNILKFTHEIFISFRELALSKDILFEFEAESSEIKLTYDRNKMEIVLCNLLSNAFKYTPVGSRIILSIKEFHDSENELYATFPNGYCEIMVKDNGQGMSEEMVGQIFDRFFQIVNTKSVNLIGTGIGLALVKNIVELHSGKVFVKSEEGRGSTFIIQLPLGDKHFNKNQFIQDFKRSEDSSHYKIERVLQSNNISYEDSLQDAALLPSMLIVEDNSEIRAFVKTVFEAKYNIYEATNGVIGLQKAKNLIPDVIITDLMMPEMDGLALCNQLKATEETLHIPIIMLTARTTAVFQEKGYDSGADIYVTKPFHPSVLKAQVDGLLNNRRKLKDYFTNNITLQPDETEIASFDKEFLNEAMKIVEDNLSNEKLNRDFLASALSMSSSTLYRKIKSLTGIDTTVFIRSIRLKMAAQMIQNKEDNISGCAYQVGFNDIKYFRKCFKKQFGINPSQLVEKKNTIIK